MLLLTQLRRCRLLLSRKTATRCFGPTATSRSSGQLFSRQPLLGASIPQLRTSRSSGSSSVHNHYSVLRFHNYFSVKSSLHPFIRQPLLGASIPRQLLLGQVCTCSFDSHCSVLRFRNYFSVKSSWYLLIRQPLLG